MGTRTQVAVPLRPRRMPSGGNLPNEVDSFVGREAELERLRELHTDTRLLTLVGPGGVGKTRLALRLLAVVRDSFPDGTWLADLGPVRDATLVPQALGDVFGVRQQPGQPSLDELTRALRAHRLVLLLDNCEHVVEPCCEIVEGLLRACPDLTVITTSQQPLGATGELTWRVPPLSLPVASATLPRELEASEAVRLLLARIRSRMPDFQLTDGNAAHIGEICRRLDGLPLALELVAARVESLGVVEVATRLSDRFTLVVGVQPHRTRAAAGASGDIGMELQPARRGRVDAPATPGRFRGWLDTRGRGSSCAGTPTSVARTNIRGTWTAGNEVSGRCRSRRG